MQWALLVALVVAVNASQLLNSVNEVNLEGEAFASRMTSLSDEAKEAASEIAAVFFSSLHDENGMSDDQAMSMYLALPLHVQHELKHVFPEFFNDDMDEEEQERLDGQSRAFSLS